MERDEQGRLLTGAGILAGIVGLIVFFGKRRGPMARELFAEITVHENGTEVSYSPEIIEGASKSRRDFVTWRVTNQSHDRVEVCVKGFKHLHDNTCEDPLDDEDSDEGKCRRVSARDDRKIKTRVKKSAREGVYKYSIYLNDREVEDPRLAIVD